MHTAYLTVMSLTYLANFLVILNLVFRERKKVESTIGWITILMIAPYVGLFFYLLFGRGVKKANMYRVKNEEDIALKSLFKSAYDGRVKRHSIMKNEQMISTFVNLDNGLLTDGNKIKIYTDGYELFEELKDVLRNAKRYINIQYYIFKYDDIGREIIEILEEKLKEGVKVRFLYDDLGSRHLKRSALQLMRDLGGKVEAFFPFRFRFINMNVNYRNHRKIVVVDGEIGFIGGFNVGDEYLGKNKKFGYWRDTHLKLEGGAVDALNLRFLMDWRYASGEDIVLNKYISSELLKPGDVPIQMVSSGPDMVSEEIKYGYLMMIQKAKKYVYIQTPYLIIDEAISDSLKIAALSGVDVRIMIPSKPDHPFIYWASYSFAGDLIKHGVKVYIYDKQSFLHAKTVVVDDEVCSIGTANMDIRSFALNFEVNAFIYSEEVSIEQRKIFENDMIKCSELTISRYNRRSIIIKIKESISRLLSPIL